MKGKGGISLIEVLISILIIALIAGPFTGMFLKSTRLRRTMTKQLNAIYTVRNEMEILMSKDSLEVYRSNGIKNSHDFFIRTLVAPYSTKADIRCFYIIARAHDDTGDEIIVFTPDGCKTFLLEGDGNFYTIDINIDESSFNVNAGGQSISGNLQSSGKSDIQINLIDKQSCNYLDFNVTGDTDITIYPGNDNNWNMNFDKNYTVVDKCFYRDYSIFMVKVEAFNDASLNDPIFGIENIIKVAN